MNVLSRYRGANVLDQSCGLIILPQENGRIKERSDFAAVYYLCGGRQAYCLYIRPALRRCAYTNSLSVALPPSPHPRG
jgi:hypothetical protein